jgi:dienelactone hydrolase
MTRSTGFTRDDVRFTSDDAECAAWLYLPDGVDAPPVVVLGHGLGAVREMRLDGYGERFAQAGMAAFAFTYRHFGDSGGHPRQLLSIKRQLADWDAAIDHVKQRGDVDGTRVAVWGSSFGGGHVLTVSSRHPELVAAVSQCPFTDGLASARALGARSSLKLMPYVFKDWAAQLRGAEPVTLPLAGAPGTLALMNAHDALPGYLGLVPPGLDFVNEAAARVVPTLSMYRPGKAVKKITMPILFCVSNHDTVTPPQQTIDFARTAPYGEIKTYEAGHFAFYVGDAFEEIVADQLEFLTRHVPATVRP